MPLSPDRPSIRPWAKGQPVDHRRLNELQGAVITDIQIHGPPGTRWIRKGNSFALFLPEPPPASPAPFWVYVHAPLTGGGKYYGYIAGAPGTAISVTTDLASAEMFTSAGEEVVIFNTLENGTPDHILTDPGGIPNRPILAWWHPGRAETDEDPPRRICLIADVGYFHDCPEEEE